MILSMTGSNPGSLILPATKNKLLGRIPETKAKSNATGVDQ
jgi:hypothetical protein